MRAAQKKQTREAILDVAARLFRQRGLAGAGVATIMKDAGLTHGGFYVHFGSRRALVTAVLHRAAERGRLRLLRGLAKLRGLAWIRGAVGRYLTPDHRDAPGSGCVIASLSSDVGREDAALRREYEPELRALADAFAAELEAAGDAEADERALALVALCAGGVTLARAVADRRLSDRILRACRRLADRDLHQLTRLMLQGGTR